jgi:L-alanine-DL-glutamate epimerase-like enolase superfamily enzyme
VNRRDWIRSFGAAALPAAGREKAAVEVRIVRLHLRHTWTTTMASSEFRDTVHVAYRRDGITGRGEGAPIVRYGESAESARRALETLCARAAATDPWRFHKLGAEMDRLVAGEYAAKAALEIALWDWIGQKLGVPLYQYFGLDPDDAPITTFSIGIDTPEVTRRKVREAEPFPVLKIKVGLANDEETIEAVRSETDKPLRVDANEGWKTKEEALEKIRWLETQGVELVEQPLPAAMVEETRWLRERVRMPIFADEAVLRPTDIPRLATAYDGVNIKLDKCGGILPAWRMIEIARALGLKTMLGCMISSSVSVTAAAHLAPLVDYADLDGNLLIANDPYSGVQVDRGKLILPRRPGLGLVEAA